MILYTDTKMLLGGVETYPATVEIQGRSSWFLDSSFPRLSHILEDSLPWYSFPIDDAALATFSISR